MKPKIYTGTLNITNIEHIIITLKSRYLGGKNWRRLRWSHVQLTMTLQKANEKWHRLPPRRLVTPFYGAQQPLTPLLWLKCFNLSLLLNSNYLIRIGHYSEVEEEGKIWPRLKESDNNPFLRFGFYAKNNDFGVFNNKILKWKYIYMYLKIHNVI